MCGFNLIRQESPASIRRDEVQSLLNRGMNVKRYTICLVIYLFISTYIDLNS